MKKSRTNKVLSLLLAIVMVVGMLPFSAIPVFAAGLQGEGTIDDPYLVYTYGELSSAIKKNGKSFGVDYWGGQYVDFETNYIKLMVDIVCTDALESNRENPVSIDLNGKTISYNMTGKSNHTLFDFDYSRFDIRDKYDIDAVWSKCDLEIIDSVGGGKLEVTAPGTMSDSSVIRFTQDLMYSDDKDYTLRIDGDITISSTAYYGIYCTNTKSLSLLGGVDIGARETAVYGNELKEITIDDADFLGGVVFSIPKNDCKYTLGEMNVRRFTSGTLLNVNGDGDKFQKAITDNYGFSVTLDGETFSTVPDNSLYSGTFLNIGKANTLNIYYDANQGKYTWNAVPNAMGYIIRTNGGGRFAELEILWPYNSISYNDLYYQVVAQYGTDDLMMSNAEPYMSKWLSEEKTKSLVRNTDMARFDLKDNSLIFLEDFEISVSARIPSSPWSTPPSYRRAGSEYKLADAIPGALSNKDIYAKYQNGDLTIFWNDTAAIGQNGVKYLLSISALQKSSSPSRHYYDISQKKMLGAGKPKINEVTGTADHSGKRYFTIEGFSENEWLSNYVIEIQVIPFMNKYGTRIEGNGGTLCFDHYTGTDTHYELPQFDEYSLKHGAYGGYYEMSERKGMVIMPNTADSHVFEQDQFGYYLDYDFSMFTGSSEPDYGNIPGYLKQAYVTSDYIGVDSNYVVMLVDAAKYQLPKPGEKYKTDSNQEGVLSTKPLLKGQFSAEGRYDITTGVMRSGVANIVALLVKIDDPEKWSTSTGDLVFYTDMITYNQDKYFKLNEGSTGFNGQDIVISEQSVGTKDLNVRISLDIADWMYEGRGTSECDRIRVRNNKTGEVTVSYIPDANKYNNVINQTIPLSNGDYTVYYDVVLRDSNFIMTGKPLHHEFNVKVGTKEPPYSASTVSFSATGYDKGTLTVNGTNFKYRVGDNGSYLTPNGNTIQLSGLASGTKIYIIKPARSASYVDSDPFIIKVSRQSKAQSVSSANCSNIDNNNGRFTVSDSDTSATFKYKKVGTASWISCTNNTSVTNLTPGTYQVVKKASGNKLESEPYDVVIEPYNFTGMTHIEITGVAEPIPGIKSSDNAVVANAGGRNIVAKVETWDENGGYFPGQYFRCDKEYTACLFIENEPEMGFNAPAIFAFGENIKYLTATVNGHPATITQSYNGRFVRIEYTFPKTPMVYSSISGTVTIPGNSDSPITVNVTGPDSYSNSLTIPVQAGKSSYDYQLDGLLAEEYRLEVTQNGCTTDTAFCHLSSEPLIKNFELLKAKVTRVDMSLTIPEVGSNPIMPTVSSPENVTINEYGGWLWNDEDGNTISKSDVFMAGHTYTLTLTFSSEASGTHFTDNTSVVINNDTVPITSKVYDRVANALKVTVKYTFPGISVNSRDHKTIYRCDNYTSTPASLDVTGLTVRYINQTGNESTVPVTADMVSGFNGGSPLNQTRNMTISYQGYTTTLPYYVCFVRTKLPALTIDTPADQTADVSNNSNAYVNLWTDAKHDGAVVSGLTAKNFKWYQLDKNNNETPCGMGTLLMVSKCCPGVYRYYCEVTDTYGQKARTGIVTVTVNPRLVITDQTRATKIAPDRDFFPFVTVTGGTQPYTYEWQYKWSSNWITISDAVRLPEKISRTYRCVVTDAEGFTVISDSFKLTAYKELTIDKQPIGVFSTIETEARLSVAASGGEGTLTYQWYVTYEKGSEGGASFTAKVDNLSNAAGEFVRGAKTSELRILANYKGEYENRYADTQEYQNVRYYCVITDGAGTEVQTDAVFLIFTDPPVSYYEVTVTADHGTVTATPSLAAEGEEITLFVTPDEGYVFKEWQSTDVIVINNRFTMPANEVTITAVFEKVYAVTGSVTSFGDASGTVTLQLKQGDTVKYTTTTASGNYSFSAVAPGNYTLVVSKANHVTREYTVTVTDAAVSQNVEIRLLGDITGDGNVNTSDVGRANAHAKNSSLLTDYALKCADVTGDGNVNTSDVGRINAHAKGSNPLWK